MTICTARFTHRAGGWRDRRTSSSSVPLGSQHKHVLDRCADAFDTVGASLIFDNLDMRQARSERDLLFALRTEVPSNIPVHAIAAACREKPEELIHAELLELLRARHVKQIEQADNRVCGASRETFVT